MRFVLLTLVSIAAMSGLAAAQPQLAVQGQPYFEGDATLTVVDGADVGQPVLVALGLNPLPLDVPLMTGKGPWYIGLLVNSTLLGVVPADGVFRLDFTMPPEAPALIGIPIVLQAFVSGRLSNPTTLPLDKPYFLSANAAVIDSPNATNVGKFGDRTVVGDLNGDGVTDLVVGAWFEDTAGIDRSGRAYVFWGPSFSTTTTLEPVAPKLYGEFGMGLAISDLDDDGIDDLIVGEGTGNPPPVGQPASLYVYSGGPTFSSSPSTSIQSDGSGAEYTLFGRNLAVADFDNNGFPDIAVGLPNRTVAGLTHAGQVDVYRGPDFTTIVHLNSPNVGQDDYFGEEITASDVTGDGISDLIEANARETVGGVFGIGRVYLFSGPGLGSFKTLENPLPDGVNSRFGNDVIGTDINGDGIAEVVTTDERNHVYVFWSPSFDTYQLIVRPPDPGLGTGVSVSFGYFVDAGDVNGDGEVDIAIGEPFAPSEGRALVALGPYYSSFLVLQDQLPATSAEFGWGVLIDDVTGDGRDDLLVGADLATGNGVLGAGHTTIFRHPDQ